MTLHSLSANFANKNLVIKHAPNTMVDGSVEVSETI